jgi:hypothetical protein
MHAVMRFTAPVLLLLFYGTALSTACTEAILNDPCSNAVVSARTFSFDAELSPRVTAGKPVPLWLLLLLVLPNTMKTAFHQGCTTLLLLKFSQEFFLTCSVTWGSATAT